MTQNKKTSDRIDPAEPFEDCVHEALKQWHQDDVTDSALQHLRIFQIELSRGRLDPKQVTQQILVHSLGKLEPERPDDAALLRSRFLDNELAYKVANQLNISEATLYRKQAEAIRRLAGIIAQMEQEVRAEYQSTLEARLEPPTYTNLVGVEKQLDLIEERVISPGPPWIIAIEGIGGIGKTSLADALARRLMTKGVWDAYGWVTARQAVFNLGGSIDLLDRPKPEITTLIDDLAKQLLGELAASTMGYDEKIAALAVCLNERRHLVFVDNLETIDDLQRLLPTLRQLGNPSKFVLTSRESLYSEPDIAHIRVPELEPIDAIQLVRQEATLRNLTHVAGADNAELSPIVEIVGGNPLALRLITGQLHIYPLEEVLDELQEARGRKAESLYTFIYRRAWDKLDEAARNALLVMPLVTEQGGTLELLVNMSRIERSELFPALDKLVSLNLVDSRGTLNKRTYSIHSLTRTFVHRQVALWQME